MRHATTCTPAPSPREPNQSSNLPAGCDLSHRHAGALVAVPQLPQQGPQLLLHPGQRDALLLKRAGCRWRWGQVGRRSSASETRAKCSLSVAAAGGWWAQHSWVQVAGTAHHRPLSVLLSKRQPPGCWAALPAPHLRSMRWRRSACAAAAAAAPLPPPQSASAISEKCPRVPLLSSVHRCTRMQRQPAYGSGGDAGGSRRSRACNRHTSQMPAHLGLRGRRARSCISGPVAVGQLGLQARVAGGRGG